MAARAALAQVVQEGSGGDQVGRREPLLEPAIGLGEEGSPGAGYGLGRLVRLPRPLCIAIGFEVGIHNSTLALYLALGVLQQFPVALPAALYSVSMYVTGLLFGMWLRHRPLARSRAG